MFIARWPTVVFWPSFEKWMTEGASFSPSKLSAASGFPPSMEATAEYVVPRSIPTTLLLSFPMTSLLREHEPWKPDAKCALQLF